MGYAVEEPSHIVALRESLRRFVEREMPREQSAAGTASGRSRWKCSACSQGLAFAA